MLTDLINAVLHPAPPRRVTQVLNPNIQPDDLVGKNIVLDILAEDEQGQRIGIEMQLQRFLHWPQRSIYGVARSLAGQLQAGQDYRLLKPTIAISHAGPWAVQESSRQSLLAFYPARRRASGSGVGGGATSAYN